MKDHAIEWLLEDNNPSVKFFTLTELLKKPLDDDEEVIKAKKLIMEEGIVPEILKKQNEDGSWSEPERFYTDKYKGTVWTLLILAELGADQENEQIKKACEFILNYSQELEEGGFSYKKSAKSNSGIPSGVVPCLTGNMVYSLVKLGYLNDKRVKKAIDWIVKYQRVDDGESHAPKGSPYERYGMCWGHHSCHMGVAKALKALAGIPEQSRTDEINAKIDQLAEYFLKHHIYKKSHNLEEISHPGWLKPGFPLMYQTDIFELLFIFANLKIKDDRMNEALEIIKSKRTEEGLWKMESSFNGKMNAEIEKKGKPSKWITYRALKILKEYRGGEALVNIDFLLESDEPWTVYRTLIDILEFDEEDSRVKKARKAMIEHPFIKLILEELHDWPGKVISSHKSAGQAYHKLSFLADVGIKAEDDDVSFIINKIKGYKSDDGLFELPANTPVKNGQNGDEVFAWALCDAPLILYSVSKIDENSREDCRKGVDFLFKLCRDNGWPCAVSEKLGNWRGPGKKQDPCPYANLLMLKLLGLFDEYKNSKETSNGIETLLNLWDKSMEEHPYMFFAGNDFRKLKAPYIWYDILHVAEVITQYEAYLKDARLQSMIEVINSKVQEQGVFKPESDWRAWDFINKKKPSPWMTFLVYRINKRVYRDK